MRAANFGDLPFLGQRVRKHPIVERTKSLVPLTSVACRGTVPRLRNGAVCPRSPSTEQADVAVRFPRRKKKEVSSRYVHARQANAAEKCGRGPNAQLHAPRADGFSCLFDILRRKRKSAAFEWLKDRRNPDGSKPASAPHVTSCHSSAAGVGSVGKGVWAWFTDIAV